AGMETKTTPLSFLLAAAIASALAASGGCESRASHSTPTASSALVHLDLELANARVKSSPAPGSAVEERVGSFAEPQKEWHTVSSTKFPGLAGVEVAPQKDAWRVSLSAPAEGRHSRMLVGGIAIDLPPGPLNAWTGVRVRARSHARMGGIGA